MRFETFDQLLNVLDDNKLEKLLNECTDDEANAFIKSISDLGYNKGLVEGMLEVVKIAGPIAYDDGLVNSVNQANRVILDSIAVFLTRYGIITDYQEGL